MGIINKSRQRDTSESRSLAAASLTTAALDRVSAAKYVLPNRLVCGVGVRSFNLTSCLVADSLPL